MVKCTFISMNQNYYIPIQLLCICVALFLCSCNPEAKRMREDPLNRIFEEHEAMQLKQFQMKLVAAGVPSEEDIDQFALHYVTFQKMKVPEVRKLIVTSVEDFLQEVNLNGKLHPKLKKHPITYRNVKFNVGFGSIDGTFQEPPYIAYAYLDEGILYYCYEDRLFFNFIEEENIEEPYEEALKILQEQSIEGNADN